MEMFPALLPPSGLVISKLGAYMRCLRSVKFNLYQQTRSQVHDPQNRRADGFVLLIFSSETIWLILCGLCVCVCVCQQRHSPFPCPGYACSHQGEICQFGSGFCPSQPLQIGKRYQYGCSQLIPANGCGTMAMHVLAKLWPFFIFPQNQSVLRQFSQIHLTDHESGDLT